MCEYLNFLVPFISSLIRALDVSEDGDIDYEEFIAAAIDRKRVLNIDTLVQIYRSMDKDNDGTGLMGWSTVSSVLFMQHSYKILTVLFLDIWLDL